MTLNWFITNNSLIKIKIIVIKQFIKDKEDEFTEDALPLKIS